MYRGSAEHSDLYRKTIASARWRKLRQERILATGYRCEHCKKVVFSKMLALHHKTYDRLGKELPTDIELLCPPCHEDADGVRARVTAVRSANRLWGARLDGWASKVYGDDWAYNEDPEAVEEHFESWLEHIDGPR